MKVPWTRRRFLAVAGVSTAAGLWGREALAQAAARPSVLTRAERATLSAFADAIIPKAGRMPAAGEAGAVAYLDVLASADEAIAGQLRTALKAIDDGARAARGRGFTRLDGPGRAAVLTALERTAPDTFHPAKNLVYEGYYTQAAVQDALGYRFVPAGGEGPPVEAFEEHLLGRVKGLAPFYRKVR
jgi:hypothetical protein